MCEWYACVCVNGLCRFEQQLPLIASELNKTYRSIIGRIRAEQFKVKPNRLSHTYSLTRSLLDVGGELSACVAGLVALSGAFHSLPLNPLSCTPSDKVHTRTTPSSTTYPCPGK